jgi:hypothetical protein
MPFMSNFAKGEWSAPFAVLTFAAIAFTTCGWASATPAATAGSAPAPAPNIAAPKPGAAALPGTRLPAFAGDVEVQVLGVAIPFTSFGVVHRLQTVPGVVNVQFNLKQGEAILRLKPGAYVTDEILRNAVRNASYTPGEIAWASTQDQLNHAREQKLSAVKLAK